MFIKAKNRFHAFAIHLFISLIIFIVLAGIIIYFWYPGFLFRTDGGWDGIRLIAGIDFIIGPTLTLIVYKVGKPGLKFDFFIIGCIQFLCLTYGTWTVYQQRPIAVMYVNGEFLAKSQVALEIHNVDLNEIYKLDSKIPAWIYIDLPDDKDEIKKIFARELFVGLVYTQSKRFRPYKENLDKILKKAIDPSTLDEEIAGKINSNGKIYPYSARFGSGYIEIDKNTGDFIRIH